MSILHAVEVPPFGGDTTWTDLVSAYAGLAEPIQGLADRLRAEHRVGAGYLPAVGEDAFVEELRDNPVASVHPVVRVIPETGDKALFVNPVYTERIAGVSRMEGRLLLQLFFEQITRPEYTVRFRWTPGSVALADNRVTAHLSPRDLPAGSPRVMHRLLLAGEVPVGSGGAVSEAVAGVRLAA